jgi:hypothetical protein
MRANPLAGLDDALRPYWRVLAAVGVLAMLLGGLWASEAAGRVERSVEQFGARDAWSERGAFSYQVPVVRDSPMFANGTVLGEGEPGYFASVSPFVNLAFDWGVSQPAQAVQAMASMELAVRSDAPSGRPYWTLHFPLANASGSLAPGQALHVAGVLDIPQAQQRVQDAMAALGTHDDKLAWTIVSEVQFTAAGVANASTFELPIDLQGALYHLPPADALAMPRDHGRPVEVVHEQKLGLAGLWGAPLPLGLLGGGAVGLVLAARARRADARYEALPDGAYVRELEAHRDWVTPVRGPLLPPAGARVIEVEALGDLVDVAAEARTRVLLDEARREFVVLSPSAFFRYARHRIVLDGEPEESPAWAAADALEPRDGDARERVRGRRRP